MFTHSCTETRGNSSVCGKISVFTEFDLKVWVVEICRHSSWINVDVYLNFWDYSAPETEDVYLYLSTFFMNKCRRLLKLLRLFGTRDRRCLSLCRVNRFHATPRRGAIVVKARKSRPTEPWRLAKQAARRNRVSRVPSLIFLSSDPSSHNFLTRQKTLQKNSRRLMRRPPHPKKKKNSKKKSRGFAPPDGLQTHESIFTSRTLVASVLMFRETHTFDLNKQASFLSSLGFSLSSYRQSYIDLVFSSRFID